MNQAEIEMVSEKKEITPKTKSTNRSGGNQTLRHLSALMKKNAINWRRTWMGSLFELLCPVLLMTILVLVRTIDTLVDTVEAQDPIELQYPLYDPTSYNTVQNKFVVNPTVTSNRMNDFLTYTEYPKIDDDTNQYDMTQDIFSPLYFKPRHCQNKDAQKAQEAKQGTDENEEDNKQGRDAAYNSPIIALIPAEGSQIQATMKTQLETIWSISNKDFFRFEEFESKDKLFAYIEDSKYGLDEHPGVCFGFTVHENSATDVEVELFFNPLNPREIQSLPSQEEEYGVDQTQKSPDLQSFYLYAGGGFSLMENLAANAVLKFATNNNNANIATVMMPFKAAATTTDYFPLVLMPTFSFFLQLMYIPFLYNTINRVVSEKSTRARESMRMMGMSDVAYWLSWVIYWTAINTVIATSNSILLCINVFQAEHWFAIWLFLWLFGQSLFGLLLIAQALFNSPKTAASTSSGLYFCTSLIQQLLITENTQFGQKVAACWFFPTLSMINGSGPLVNNFAAGRVANWTLRYQQFSVLDATWLMIVGGINLFLIGLYLEYVLPKEFGRRRHPLFFLMCCCNKSEKKTTTAVDIIADGDHETQYLDKNCYEGVPQEIARKEAEEKILKVSNLKKVFDNGFKAVDGVNIKMYEDQIFVLLGHNGAGKTTTINMLTGLFEQTHGSAKLYDYDMFNNMDGARQIMGVCPQHDILFELMTVEEHLSVFYDLKGADPKLKKAEIEKLLKDVGLSDQKDKKASTLSGGNKRKLSVAIAMCGQSKFVLLDEPTSGLDLSARRVLWNMLKEYKKDRIILLTTHYMDEADILGDRIAIMKSGRVQALGSSIFLKSKFGAGYNLVVVKSSTSDNTVILPYLQDKLGQDVIKQSEIQSEMTLTIPNSYSNKFLEFFQDFDQKLDDLGIQSYGITISTLEEVFLKVGNLDDKAAPGLIDNANDKPKDMEDQKAAQEFNFRDNAKEVNNSFFNNFMAVMYMRFSNYKRNKAALFNDAVLPCILLILGVGLSQIDVGFEQPSRIIQPDRLPLPQQLIINPEPVSAADTDIQIGDLYSTLPNQPGSFNLIEDEDYSSTTTITEYIDEIFDNRRSELPYMYGSYQTYSANKADQQYKFVSHLNLTAYDSPGLYPQFMYESIMKQATDNDDFKFKVRLTPYPPTTRLLLRANGEELNTIIIQMSIAFGIFLAGIARYIVVERESGLKHLQIISGMQLKAYWVATFICDFLKMYLTILVAIILWAAFDLDLNAAMVPLALLPFGALPFTYATTFVFSSSQAASSINMFLNILILGILASITWTFRIAIPPFMDYGDSMHSWFWLIPSYNIGAAMFCDRQCDTLADVRKAPYVDAPETDADKWAFPNLTRDSLVMLLHMVVWSIVIMVIEKGWLSVCSRKPKAKTSDANDLDDDVVAEQQRVEQQTGTPDMVNIQGLNKVFSISKGCCKSEKFNAVTDLSFGLQQGECFALLGVNGAGKSTTFKSLTGMVNPSKGNVQISGYDIKKDFEKARKLIGYCPQENLIFDEMTVEEHLKYYAQVKGIPSNIRVDIIEKSISQLGLDTHRTKMSKTLSGGNKRKLCVAIALLGNPSVILLDEPSAGMDPESRRFMWSVVGRIAQKKSSAVVLTTHSMEEAEALSTKMGILVKGGVFKCYGSAQHIKNKFGTGYVIEIKTKTLDASEIKGIQKKLFPDGSLVLDQFDDKIKENINTTLNEIKNQNDMIRQAHAEVNLFKCIIELCRTFTNVKVIEKYGNYVRVRVDRLDKSIGSVFGQVEGFKGDYDVSEYSVSQTTLEQIFQTFADVHFSVNVQEYALTGPNSLTLKSDTKQIE